MKLACPLSALVLVACLGAAPVAHANQVVILTSGNRMEVASALPVGFTGWQLTLVGGGTIELPASAVHRVSNEAKDMRRAAGPVIAASAGSWHPQGSSSAPADGRSASIPAGIPRDAVRAGLGKFEAPETLRAPRFDPETAVAPASIPRVMDAKAMGGVGSALAMTAPRTLSAQAATRNASVDPRRANFRRTTGGIMGGPGRNANAIGPGTMRPMSGGDPGRSGGLPRLN